MSEKYFIENRNIVIHLFRRAFVALRVTDRYSLLLSSYRVDDMKQPGWRCADQPPSKTNNKLESMKKMAPMAQDDSDIYINGISFKAFDLHPQPYTMPIQSKLIHL